MSVVAFYPVEPRDLARMLVAKNNNLTHAKILDLPDFIDKNCLIIANNCKVVKARLQAVRLSDQRKFSLLLMQKDDLTSDKKWQALAYPKKHLKIGDKLAVTKEETTEKTSTNQPDSLVTVEDIDKQGITISSEKDFSRIMQDFGSVPLPPYIKRSANKKDEESYQTIFAEHGGAVAAPTAGLHFTERLIKKLQEKGAKIIFLTLIVGGGTFLPLREHNFKESKLHKERFLIGKSEWQEIKEAVKSKRQILTIGTTSLRAIEAAFKMKDTFQADEWQETDIFINQHNPPLHADVLLTNFHQEDSSLIELVKAFSSEKTINQVYQEAKDKGYRFYSYGDASLFFKQN